MTLAEPSAEKSCCTSATSTDVADEPPQMAEAPERTETGRLGMTRTTRELGSASSRVAMVTPAAIETTRRPLSASAHDDNTPLSTCGFTASTTTASGLAANSASASAKVWMPQSLARASSL